MGGTSRRAVDYVLHVQLGGLAGVIAPMIGRHPADYHIWILEGTAPAFIREEGQLYRSIRAGLSGVSSKSAPLSRLTRDANEVKSEPGRHAKAHVSLTTSNGVISECNDLRVSEVIGAGPLKELNLCDGLGTNPLALLHLVCGESLA